MKRRIFLLLLAAALCLTAAASAIELTFAQTCWDKTSRDVTLYVRVEEGGSLIAAQTLPAGTYIRPTGDTAEGKAGISYGFEQYGYIDGSAIVSASRTITLPSGRHAKKLTIAASFSVCLIQNHIDEIFCFPSYNHGQQLP